METKEQLRLRSIDKIPKTDKREGVILIGRGPSVDQLDIEALDKQTKYDICTISDAIKLTTNITYAFHNHHQGLVRSINFVHIPKYLIMTSYVPTLLADRNLTYCIDILNKLDNDYYFHHRNTSDLAVFKEGSFELEVTDKLFSRHGTVGSVMHFLLGYMRYKMIYYIGFDGGLNYGKQVHSHRKLSKRKGAAKDYERSWETVLSMITHYDVDFQPLQEFLI